jgi:hypothetical protein
MQNIVKPLMAKNKPVSRFVVIAKPKYLATQGKANEATTTKEALNNSFKIL